MVHIPTGYKPGRPRKGEIRPLTIGGLASAKVRADKKAKMGDAAYNHERAIYQKFYTLANKEKVKAIARGTARRAKNRNDPFAIFVVS